MSFNNPRDLSFEGPPNECRLTTPEPRRLRGDKIGLFKILNGYDSIDSHSNKIVEPEYMMQDSRTRGLEVR